MNKSQVYLNKMLAMVMLAYAISVVVGEAIRDVQYAQISPDEFNLLSVLRLVNVLVGFCFLALSYYSSSATV